MAPRAWVLSSDGDTGQAREGGIEVVDDYTVRITFPPRPISRSCRALPTILPPSSIRDLIGTNPLDHGIGTGDA